LPVKITPSPKSHAYEYGLVPPVAAAVKVEGCPVTSGCVYVKLAASVEVTLRYCMLVPLLPFESVTVSFTV